MQISAPFPSRSSPSHPSYCSALWTPLTQQMGPSTLPTQLSTSLTSKLQGSQSSPGPSIPHSHRSQPDAHHFLPRLGCTDASYPTQLMADLSEEWLFPQRLWQHPSVPASPHVSVGMMHTPAPGKSLSGAEAQPQLCRWAGAHKVVLTSAHIIPFAQGRCFNSSCSPCTCRSFKPGMKEETEATQFPLVSSPWPGQAMSPESQMHTYSFNLMTADGRCSLSQLSMKHRGLCN